LCFAARTVSSTFDSLGLRVEAALSTRERDGRVGVLQPEFFTATRWPHVIFTDAQYPNIFFSIFVKSGAT
jgi:hypothetical protein